MLTSDLEGRGHLELAGNICLVVKDQLLQGHPEGDDSARVIAVNLDLSTEPEIDRAPTLRLKQGLMARAKQGGPHDKAVEYVQHATTVTQTPTNNNPLGNEKQ